MADLLVKKACKDFGKQHGMRFPDRVIESLDAKVKDLITRASERADGNGRKTIMETDL